LLKGKPSGPAGVIVPPGEWL
jgi:hypothetical protein